MTAKPKPTTTKNDKKRLVKKLDQAIRAVVLSEEKVCCCCGTTERLQLGHLFTRSKHSVRWDRDNCHAQCAGCNLRHEYDPHPYTVWYIQTFGLAAYTSLYHRAETPRKWKLHELQELLNRLEAK